MVSEAEIGGCGSDVEVGREVSKASRVAAKMSFAVLVTAFRGCAADAGEDESSGRSAPIVPFRAPPTGERGSEGSPAGEVTRLGSLESFN